MRVSSLTTVCCAALLGACATGYEPESVGNRGGYSELKRGPGVWHVRFVSNDEGTQDRSDDLALLRAADLCLADDKRFMRTGRFDSRADVIGNTAATTVHRPTEIGPLVPGSMPGSYYPSQVRRTEVMPGRTVYQFFSALEVTCLAEKSDDTLEAAAIAAEIRQRYGMAAPRSAS